MSLYRAAAQVALRCMKGAGVPECPAPLTALVAPDCARRS